jgi:hypothetical protein
MKDISRRDFIKYLGAGTIGLLTNPRIPLFNKKTGRQASDVVQCYDDNATSGSSTINSAVVRIMTDESIKTLTGLSDVGEAWKSVFPGIDENSIIGIKVNCLFQITTHLEFTYCLVDSLAQMQFSGNGYHKNNIIIWDNQDNLLIQNGGYTIYTGNDPDTARCFGTSHSGVGYDSLQFNVNGVTSYPSMILSTLCDYIVNAAVIKDHSMSQITLTMKNNYGSINNPGSLHGGQCNPYIPSVNQQIRDVITPNDKQKIFIVDGLFGCYSGGPGGSPNFNPKMVLMSLDPVAIDYHGQYLINQERIAHGLGTYNAPHITTAAQSPYNLGTTNVNLIEINNPSGVSEAKITQLDKNLLKIAPNPFKKKTSLFISSPNTSAAKIDLIDASGRIITNIYKGQINKGMTHINFNADSNIKAGTYFIRLNNQGMTTVRKITMLQ